MKGLTVLSALMLALSIGVNLAGLTLRQAQAIVPSKPYTFVAGTRAQSAQVNSDFDTLYSVLNANLDHTNFNTTGIYASQIVPDSSANATFGGSLPYTFPALVSAPALADTGLTANGYVCTDAGKTLTSVGCTPVTPGSSPSFAGVTVTGLSANATVVCTNASSALSTAGCGIASIYDSGSTAHALKALYLSVAFPNIGPCASLAVCSTVTYTPPGGFFTVLPDCHGSVNSNTQTPFMTLGLSAQFAAGPFTFEEQNQTSGSQSGAFTFDVVCIGY